MTWLPENYEKPVASGGNYMKLTDGQNKFRVLSAPIIGYEYWTDENKPVRLKEMPEESPEDMKEDGKLKHFWAFVVWNYREKRVQILELTQLSIQGPITDLVNAEDWGNPQQYDLTITKKGQKLDTEYTVQPSPHKELSKEILQAFDSANINLELLFAGQDPFGIV